MRKTTKRIITMVIVLVLMMVMISCVAPETADPVEVIGGSAGYWVYLFVDPNTNVNYFILDGGSNGGRAMIPRYNADGTLYTEVQP